MFKYVYVFWNCPDLNFDTYPNFVFDHYKVLGSVALTALLLWRHETRFGIHKVGINMYNQDDKDTQIMFFWDMMLYKMTDIYIQGVPLRTKPGISLIILNPMKILQRDLNRNTFLVWEMWRHHNICWKWPPFASRQDWTRCAIFWKVLVFQISANNKHSFLHSIPMHFPTILCELTHYTNTHDQ